jgi:hypothetical protein
VRIRRKFLNDKAFRERFEKKEVEVTLDDERRSVPNSAGADH